MRKAMATLGLVAAVCGVTVGAWAGVGQAVGRSRPAIIPVRAVAVDAAILAASRAAGQAGAVVPAPPVSAYAMASAAPGVEDAAATVPSSSGMVVARVAVAGAVAGASGEPVVSGAQVAPAALSEIVVSCGRADGTWRVVASASECPGDDALRIELVGGADS